MSMQPSDSPITGGTVLRIPAVQSPNFLTGVSGWIIKGDGSAEFNNLVIRGTFNGTDFILNSDGLFFYQGTPAAGNLIGSLASTSGTDAFGNTFPLGMQWRTVSGNDFIQVVPTGINLYSPFPGQYAPGMLEPNSTGAGATAWGNLQIISPVDNTQLDFGYINLDSSSNDGTTNNASVRIGWQGPLSGGEIDLLVTSFFGTQVTGTVTAVQPGTGTSRSVPPVAETWHAASLTAGFTTSGSDQAPRYRLEGVGGAAQVRLDGTVAAAGTNAGSATMFTLPVGYRPATRKRFTGVCNFAGNTTDGMTIVQVATTGVVTAGPNSTITQQLVLDGMTFPLD